MIAVVVAAEEEEEEDCAPQRRVATLAHVQHWDCKEEAGPVL